MTISTKPRVCLIGAGSSGIAAAKALFEAKVPFDCFETSDRVGGNWVFDNANGMSSAYEGLYINTSRERMAYSDFPMPRSISRLPAPHPDRALLRGLRRPLRVSEDDPVPDLRDPGHEGAGRAVARPCAPRERR